MKKWRAARIADDHCPWCNHPVDRASHWGEGFARPNPGDATLCINCGSVAMFGRDLRLRRPTKAELKEAQADPRIGTALEAWHAMKAAQPS